MSEQVKKFGEFYGRFLGSDAFEKMTMKLLLYDLFPERFSRFGYFGQPHSRVAGAYAREVFKKNPNISYSEFESKVLARLTFATQIVRKSLPIMKKILSRYNERHFIDYEAAHFGKQLSARTGDLGTNIVYEYIVELAKTGCSFRDQQKSLRFLLKSIRPWMNAPEKRVGDFTFRNTLLLHQESPLGIAVFNKEGRLFTTVGGIFYFDKGKRVVKLTNLQGTSADAQPAYPRKDLKAQRKFKREHASSYSRFEAQVGASWTTYFLEQLKKMSNSRTITIVEAPRKFSQSRKRYITQVRRFRKSAISAGFKPKGKGRYVH